MASTTTPQKSAITQTNPSPTSTPRPPKTPEELKQRAKDALRESLIFLLLLHFFTLTTHASLRSSLIYSNPLPGDDRKAFAIIGIVFCYVLSACMIALITSSLGDIEHGLGSQALMCALFGGVIGLAWAVFGVGEQAEFRVYLAWVVWPVVGSLSIFVMATWAGLVQGGKNERLKRQMAKKAEKKL